MVNEPYVHGLSPFLYELCQPLVFLAGLRITRGMIVYKRQLCGTLQQSFTQYASHIGCGLVYTTPADTDFINHPCCLVQQSYPEFFLCEITHQRMKEFVDVL